MSQVHSITCIELHFYRIFTYCIAGPSLRQLILQTVVEMHFVIEQLQRNFSYLQKPCFLFKLYDPDATEAYHSVHSNYKASAEIEVVKEKNVSVIIIIYFESHIWLMMLI